MPLLIELLNNEMDNAKEIFDQQEVVLLPLMSVQFVTNFSSSGACSRDWEGVDGPKHAPGGWTTQLQSGNEVIWCF